MQRREFLKIAALTPVGFRMTPMRASIHRESYAYVGTPQAIHVFAAGGEKWIPLQEVACEAPSCLALHPFAPILYATNEVQEFQGLPCGSVTAFAIGRDGHLSLIQRIRLSLSATLPRSIAISPDGAYAIVTAHGGGSYNLFSIEREGSLGCILGVVKEAGSGVHLEQQESSHPQHACFDNSGHIVAADLGTDRVHVLSTSGGTLNLHRRYEMTAGAGPSTIAVHPTGSFIVVSNRLNETICVHQYDSLRGVIGELCETLRGRTMAFQPQSSMLIVEKGKSLDLYLWNGNTGRLRLINSVNISSNVSSIVPGHSSTLLVLENQIASMSLDNLSLQRIPVPQALSCIFRG